MDWTNLVLSQKESPSNWTAKKKKKKKWQGEGFCAIFGAFYHSSYLHCKFLWTAFQLKTWFNKNKKPLHKSMKKTP